MMQRVKYQKVCFVIKLLPDVSFGSPSRPSIEHHMRIIDTHDKREEPLAPSPQTD